MVKRFTLFFVFLQGVIIAQNNPIMESGAYNPTQHTNWYFENQYPWMNIFTEGSMIKKLTFYNNLKKTEHSFYEFNEKGKQTEIKLNHKTYSYRTLRKRVNRWTLEYDGLGRLIKETKFDNKGKHILTQNWEYYSKNLVKALQANGRGKVYKNLYTYNADTLLTISENFRVKGDKQVSKRRYEYDYAENKKLKQTRLYKTNKLKYTWNYECDEKGKFVKKDTATICTNVGMDNKGRSISVKHYSDSHKNEFKEVYYKRTLYGNEYVSETERYEIVKGKEVLVMKYHVPDSLEPYYDYQYFNHKNIMIVHNRREYSEFEIKSKIISKSETVYSNKKGKPTYRLVESYTIKGLPMTTAVFGRKNKLQKTIQYHYNGKNEMLIEHYKKNKLIESYKGILSYF